MCKKVCLTTVALFCVSVLCLQISYNYACGGGVVPYVPTQSGASGSSGSSQFFFMEKGVSTDLFDVKRLQPLFRNIILSGNERKKNKNKSKENDAEVSSAENDSLNAIHNMHMSGKSDSPVLNLHRLH